jgi:hypothetical protein
MICKAWKSDTRWIDRQWYIVYYLVVGLYYNCVNQVFNHGENYIQCGLRTVINVIYTISVNFMLCNLLAVSDV